MTAILGLLSFASRKSNLDLAIWGPPQSGKTHLLAMLNSYSQRYDWAVRPANSETAEYIEMVTAYIFDRKQPAPPTVVEKPTVYSFSLRKRTGLRQREIMLRVPDAAGEMYANPIHPLFNMIEYLGSCDGIMWLVDPLAITSNASFGPTANPLTYRAMIYRTLSRLFATRYQGQGMIDKYMAFVLTKMDHPDHVEYFNEPEDYALKLLGKQVEGMLDDFCVRDRVDFFSTSALGFANPAEKLPNLDDSDPKNVKLLTTDFDPVGVFDALNWFLEELL